MPKQKQKNWLKVLNFCASNDTMKKVNATHWVGKIFAIDISNRRLIPRIHKNSYTSTKRQPTFIGAKGLNGHFSKKKSFKTANNHMKRYWTLLVTRKI